jgi:hypothetical protein
MKIIEQVHDKLLLVRNIYYLINTDTFAFVWVNCTVKEQQELERLAYDLKKDSLKKFIKNKLLNLTPFAQLSTNKLRICAQRLHVKNYQSKGKVELIKDIEDAVQRIKENLERITYQP